MLLWILWSSDTMLNAVAARANLIVWVLRFHLAAARMHCSTVLPMACENGLVCHSWGG